MDLASSLNLNNSKGFWADHRKLARYNIHRLNPKFPDVEWEAYLEREYSFKLLENKILRQERSMILDEAKKAPKRKEEFIKWFEDLKFHGPGQDSPLFNWLAAEANYDQMKWFITQEVAGEAGFEDLTAFTQVKMPTIPKLEMARNYWDEMGKGRVPGMHGPMLTRIAEEFEIENAEPDSIVPEAIALGNVMLGMAMDRHFAYHSVGALGVIELTAPARAKQVHLGLKRLGISGEGQRYYQLHSALDIRHSEDWNREVLGPLLEEYPECARSLAEGALMRLHAGDRCFKRYEVELGLATKAGDMH